MTLTASEVAAKQLLLVPKMTHAERMLFNLALHPNPIWLPFAPKKQGDPPTPQMMAYISEADVIGYGGAAGGGKTDLGLGMGLTAHRKIAIFRKEGTELTAIVDRLREILGTDKGYSGKWNIWRLPQYGLQFEFGSVPNVGAELKYKGRPKDLLHIDEADAFLESQVRFLMGWVRTTIPNQKCQTLLTFNPPTTVEGRWIVRYFAPWIDPAHPKPAAPGELRWFAQLVNDYGRTEETEVDGPGTFMHNGELVIPQSRTFIPAKVTDNKYLYGTGYMAQLQALPEPLRSQMLYGDFQAGMMDDAWQLFPTAWIQAAQARWKPRGAKGPTPKGRMDSLGVDVARGGRDNTEIARRHAMWYDELIEYPGTASPDGPTVAGHVVAARRDQAPVHIDVIGVGASPYDFLNRDGVQVIGVVANAKAFGTDQSGLLTFDNLRSQLAWRLRELLDPQYDTGIALPPDQKLAEELAAFTWKAPSRCIQVASRDEIIERVQRSPDRATAIILASIDTPRMKDLKRKGSASESARGYDPYRYMDGPPVGTGHDPYG